MYQVWVEQVADLGQVPGPEVFWMSHFDQWLPLHIYMLIVRGEGKTILVNCGPPLGYLDRMNEVWRQELGERAHMTVSQDQRIEAVLARHNLTPDAVDMVVVTPLQAYALGNITHFPRAVIVISRTGWEDLLAPPVYDPRRHMAVPDDLLRYLLFEAWGEQRVRLLADEATVLPGIRTAWVGTHHRSSLAVFIDTAAGVVGFSDTIFYYANVERNHPLGIQESMAECRVAYERLRREANILVSPYDPANQIRFPHGRVAGE
ncbi:MAG: hypothetical protein C7B45_16005 [Sulfobacillus acidophilus]|uniref:MBL fold metallo-hydrolase n=1 Tax=Sulfobacillus acidophilus TaxID=53633 RepID=A0A2T2WD88_9FIRM|nr:MAG: hypothetical protein C7B45_16005 [Sulfobacillus acidophilus]